MRECARCGGRLEEVFRFCPWCAAPLRRKLVELFPGSTRVEGTTARGLRVSRYLDEGHVRFSVWDGERVEAVVSIEDTELDRLRGLLAPSPGRRSRPQSLLERVLGAHSVNPLR